MSVRNVAVICVASFAFGGCATITSNETQPVALTTKTVDGQPVEKAKCTLKNDKGFWEVTSPAVVNVRRSSDDLMVECKKEGAADGILRAISRAAAGMFGNIIFGGAVGAIIDHAKGTGYNYPDELPVKMGASTTVDRNQSPTEVAQGQAQPQGQAQATVGQCVDKC